MQVAEVWYNGTADEAGGWTFVRDKRTADNQPGVSCWCLSVRSVTGRWSRAVDTRVNWVVTGAPEIQLTQEGGSPKIRRVERTRTHFMYLFLPFRVLG